MASAYDAKEVEVDDDDFDDLSDTHAQKKDTGILARGGSGLGLGALAKSAHNLKEIEEAGVRGEDVAIEFHLPDGRKLSGKFPVGQDVGFLKSFVANETGMTISQQIFHLDGQLMIDPLSLRDYAGVLGRSGPVAIKVTFAAEAK